MARRFFLAAFLAAGVVWGYGSALHELAGHAGSPCHQSDPVEQPSH